MIIAAVVAVALVAGIYLVMSMGGDSKDTNMQKDEMAKEPIKSETMAKESTKPTAGDAMMKKEDGVMVGGALMVSSKDIVDNAVNSKDHTTLVAAVKAAGLVETLKGKGPFTVFAPTNAAFAKLPAGTVDTLLKPENKAKLTGVLTYHVVPGMYKAADIKEGLKLKTVNGQELTFTMKDGKWWINGKAMVEIADAVSTNGVTHVIDTVLLPQ